MKTPTIIALILLALVISLGIYYYSYKPQDSDTEIPVSKKTAGGQAPEIQIDSKKSYQAVLRTSLGDITIDFHTDKTPITVNNFIVLARKGFYNKTIFHRVIKGFMIQGGDPNGDGSGGPGYQFADEMFTGDYKRGTVAMANAGPDTNGSQFFIMHQDYNLPKNYVIFGEVSGGMETVDKIAESEVGQNSAGELSKPVVPTTLESVEIIEK